MTGKGQLLQVSIGILPRGVRKGLLIGKSLHKGNMHYNLDECLHPINMRL